MGFQLVADQRMIVSFSIALIFDILRHSLGFRELPEFNLVHAALRTLGDEGFIRIGERIRRISGDSRRKD
jgi:hypothetical protein